MRPTLRHDTGPDDSVTLDGALHAVLESADRGKRASAIRLAAREADPDDLVALVADHHNSVRRNAAMSALTAGGARSVPALVRALRNPDIEVVMFAATLLGTTRDRSVVPHLVELLDGNDLNVVQAAAESLGHLRANAAVDGLARLLPRDPWLRFAAAHALGEIGDARAVPALVPLLEDDDVHEVVVKALGLIASPEALDHLAQRLVANDAPRTLDLCLSAIGDVLDQQNDLAALRRLPIWNELAERPAAHVAQRIVDVLVAMPGDPNAPSTELRVAAAAVVTALRMKKAYPALVLAARVPEIRDRVRFYALTIGRELAPSLEIALRSDDVALRELACDCVGAIGIVPLAASVARLVRSDVASVRTSAIVALGRLQHADSLETLVSTLDDATSEARAAAATALAMFDASLVAQAVVAVLPTFGRSGLLAALGLAQRSPDPAYLAALDAAVTEDDAEVRAAAAAAMAVAPRADLAAALIPLLGDASEAVRAQSVKGLARARDRAARQALVDHVRKNPASLTETLASLGRTDDPALAMALVSMLGGEMKEARLALVEAVADALEPAAEPAMVGLLGDDDPAVRRAAVRTLSRFGSKISLRHVVAAARDASWEVRADVARLLPSPFDDFTRAALERLCVDPNLTVATLARQRFEREGLESPAESPNDMRARRASMKDSATQLRARLAGK